MIDFVFFAEPNARRSGAAFYFVSIIANCARIICQGACDDDFGVLRKSVIARVISVVAEPKDGDRVD